MPLFKSLGDESINRVKIIKPNEIQFTTDIMKLILSFAMVKNGHILKIFRCLHPKIFKVRLAIFQHYERKG